MGFEPGPTREAVVIGNLKLRPGKRRRLTCLEQVPGLVFEMPQVGKFRKLTARFRRSRGHDYLLSVHCPMSATRAGRRLGLQSSDRWASTLSADRMRPVRR